jgi:repressor LexA
MAKGGKGSRHSDEVIKGELVRFTAKQGQYLAYLHLYRKLHRCSPSESEIAEYFRVSPPAVHQMIVHLEEQGLVTQEPGVARSVRVTVPSSKLPDLEDSPCQP